MSLRLHFRRVAPAVMLALSATAQQYTINTIGGNGVAGYVDGPAVGSQFSTPVATAVDPKGNVYIADSVNHRVRMISNGTVSTVAGNGTPGYSGDGGQATSAELNFPSGVAVDGAGNLYISDMKNQVIRKVTSAGVITTYAGNNGMGEGYGPDNVAATSSQLDNPIGLAVDTAGNLYIADSHSDQNATTTQGLIRMVNTAGIITTVVGLGTTAGHLICPEAVALDASGNIYISDVELHTVLKFGNGVLTLNFAGNGAIGFAGDGGPAADAELSDPIGLATDPAGNVYIADSANMRIRRVAPDGTISTIAGMTKFGYSGDGGPALEAQMSSPRGVAVDHSGNVYIADTENDAIRQLTPESNPVITSGSVSNAASFQPQVSPGALASLFGTSLSNATYTSAPPYPTSVGASSLGGEGVSVSVNGRAAPVFFVSPGQINFQVPWETAVGTPATVTVSVAGAVSNAVTVPVVSAGPGLFVSGTSAIVQNAADYTLNGPSHPAAPGSYITAYLTGSGPVSPAATDGVAAPLNSLVYATAPVSATIGTTPVSTVQFAGLAPGWVGLAQVNLLVPAGLAGGTYPLVVTIDGQASNAGNISVQ
ncbi:MAG: hypothetical protein ACLP6W_13245 [Bryobacteraceae bacterium]